MFIFMSSSEKHSGIKIFDFHVASSSQINIDLVWYVIRILKLEFFHILLEMTFHFTSFLERACICSFKN